MEISKESWDALVEGQSRDRDRIAGLQWRMVKMSKQIEKLSWMVEYLAKEVDFEAPYEAIDNSIRDAELDWNEEQLYRDALNERRE